MGRDALDLGRRRFLQAGLSLGITASLSAGTSRAADSSALITRPIPSTGERLPVIGIGTAWFGNAEYEDLRAILGRMQELGGTVIDTAALYGTSEATIGRALDELKLQDRMFIATKFDAGGGPPGAFPPGGSPPGGSPPGGAGAVPAGPPPGAPPGGGDSDSPPMAFDGIGGEESFLRSLERLRTDQVDLLQVHGMNGTEKLMPLMVKWKKESKVRYIGVTSSDPRQHDELVEVMRRHPLDFIQVNYSIVDRAAAEDVLPAAQEQGIAVLINLPFGGGGVFSKVRGLELPDWAAEFDAHSWGQVLLKYVVSHRAVTCATPGSTKISHLVDNQQAARGRLPDAAQRRKIEQFWDSL